MDEQKLTPWFGADVEPVRAGVYQRLYPDGDAYFARWDGKAWRTYWLTVPLAARRSNSVSGFQNLPWRGLAENPTVRPMKKKEAK